MKMRRFGGVMMDPLWIETRGDNLASLDFRNGIDLSLDQRELLGKWEFRSIIERFGLGQSVMPNAAEKTCSDEPRWHSLFYVSVCKIR